MRAVLLTLSMLTLAACGGDGRLMHLGKSGDGPEEFAIVPTRTLEMPPDLAELPTPTPGGSNITDPNPKGDAIAALGGNPGHLAAQGIGAADAALVAHAGRAGIQPDIRAVTSAEDEAFRGRNRRRVMEAVAGANAYYRVYDRQSLDSWAENERWRRSGAQTPSAPPPASTR